MIKLSPLPEEAAGKAFLAFDGQACTVYTKA
jgi:hypothetical protein